MKALIIGGSSGIGKETAKILLQRNVEVVLVAKFNATKIVPLRTTQNVVEYCQSLE